MRFTNILKNHILLLYLILFMFNYTMGQKNPCNCQTLQKGKETGVQCSINPVAGDNLLHAGIGLGKINGYKYISLILRFQVSAQNVKKNLLLTLSNGRILELPFMQSKLGYIGNSQVCSSCFKLDRSDISFINKYPIKSISFYLEDNLWHILKVKTNDTILIEQLKCL